MPEQVRQRDADTEGILQGTTGHVSQEERLPGGSSASRGGEAVESGALHPGEVRRHLSGREQEEEGHDFGIGQTQLRIGPGDGVETVAEQGTSAGECVDLFPVVRTLRAKQNYRIIIHRTLFIPLRQEDQVSYYKKKQYVKLPMRT